jgi:hypothetical protein
MVGTRCPDREDPSGDPPEEVTLRAPFSSGSATAGSLERDPAAVD